MSSFGSKLVWVRIDAKLYTLSTPVLGFTQIEVVAHADYQMQVRGLTLEDALTTIANPDQTGLPTQPGRERVRRNKTARVAVDVVYETRSDRLRVITVIRIERRLVERRRKS